MNINSLYGTMQTTPTSNVGAVNQSNQTPSSIPPGIGGAASATISTPAQLFSEMQQLSQQNPSEFKAVAAQLATTFQSAASQATGPQAKLLTAIANQFTQASQTGSLQPPQSQGGQAPGQSAPTSQTGEGSGHHHHHHNGGGGGGSTGASSEVAQAFESAMTVLTQAVSGTSTSSTSSASTSTTST
jgi:hypothetical protein